MLGKRKYSRLLSPELDRGVAEEAKLPVPQVEEEHDDGEREVERVDEPVCAAVRLVLRLAPHVHHRQHHKARREEQVENEQQEVALVVQPQAVVCPR